MQCKAHINLDQNGQVQRQIRLTPVGGWWPGGLQWVSVSVGSEEAYPR